MSNPRIFGQGTDYDLSARSKFAGDTDKLVLKTGSSLGPDEMGARKLTRKWWCRRDLASKFEPLRGDYDFQWRTLRIYDWESVDEGTNTLFTVYYNGFIRKTAPIIIPRFDVALRDATLHPNTEAAGGDATLTYSAPTMSYSYTVPEKPKKKDRWRYEGKFDDDIDIKEWSFQGVQLLGAADLFAQLYPYHVESVRTVFSVAQEGWVWRVTETIERQVRQSAQFSDPIRR